jgi:hypothetical protein
VSKEPKYGKMTKKIIFYDSDKRYADLKIRLAKDGISQPQFFRGIVTGYLMKDKDVMAFVYKLMSAKKTESTRKSIKRDKKLVSNGEKTLEKFALGEHEIENIFDILEKQNPDL